ncbi:hypothetical protein ANN_16845 [Periplaneta americana]|uniref:Amine oxidase domain-containing protein n=1 Tax=Periplaneta americana TaxID=6978 RepID=A0ABQ8SS23_PERAM|nr:hypothetical protein ANN_16845 [Periplaneta americana]
MAGLCEGGNEPSGSLKAIVIALWFKMPHAVAKPFGFTERMEEVQVVVVGAGAAGVAAAARLMERGVKDIVILEAEERMGGRIHTVLFGDAVLDLGAQWVHGEVGNVVYSMANRYGLLTASETEIIESPYIESTGNVVNSDIAEKIMGILTLIHKAGDVLLKDFKASLGQYYNAVFQRKMEEEFSTSHSKLGRYFLDWFQKFENSIDGSDSWFETSGRGLTEYWDCEGNLLLSWKSGGYRRVLDLLMVCINCTLSVEPRFSCTIKS